MSDDGSSLRPPAPTAAALAGLLADDDRRTVFAAVQLGATSLNDIVRVTGFAEARAAKALARLVDGHVVVAGSAGLEIDPAPMRLAARRAAEAQRPPADEYADQPPAVAKVLRSFAPGGRLTSLPVHRPKRRTVLDWLVQRFEPGRRYTEREVNELLGGHEVDHVTLRRFLVDEGFLDREGGDYWRSGGSTEA